MFGATAQVKPLKKKSKKRGIFPYHLNKSVVDVIIKLSAINHVILTVFR